MSSLTSITFNDAQATPVEHIFVPKSNNDFLTKWSDSQDGVTTEMQPTLSMSMREAKGSIKRKTTVKIAVPYRPAAIDGVTQPVKTIETILTMLVDGDAPQPEKDDLVKYTKDVLTFNVITDAVNEGNFPY